MVFIIIENLIEGLLARKWKYQFTYQSEQDQRPHDNQTKPNQTKPNQNKTKQNYDITSQ